MSNPGLLIRKSAQLAGACLAATVLFLAPIASADPPMGTPRCAMRLTVEVTPDVPNPSDAGFISSLLGNNPSFQLFLLQTVDDTHVILQLQGPGEAERCQAVVEALRNDGRVVSIDVS